jgi:hypothetical protein
LGFYLGGGFLGLSVSSWFLVCFSRFSVFVVFGRGFGGCGMKAGIFRRIWGLMVVGEFLVFEEALMLKTGGGWRVF